MKRFFSHYTLIRLLPLADAGEFANIGVVLACPETGYFDFQLMKKQKRVTQFFEEIPRDFLAKLRKELSTELAYVQTLVENQHMRNELVQVMQDLAKPRESMIRYAPLRAIMTEDPAADLAKLFERYVQRDLSIVPQYHEKMLETLVKRALKHENLAEAFVSEEIGGDDFHIRLPFVHEHNGVPIAVIKPLDLTQDEPTKIYSHGDEWLGRIRRLIALKQRPEGFLIAVEGPAFEDEKRHKAYQTIVHDLQSLDVTVVDRADTQKIVEFAKTYVN
jgi:hypothetical protein